MYPELSPPRSAQKQPFTRGRRAARRAATAGLGLRRRRRPSSARDAGPKGDALKAEAVSLKRQASAGGGGELGLPSGDLEAARGEGARGRGAPLGRPRRRRRRRRARDGEARADGERAAHRRRISREAHGGRPRRRYAARRARDAAGGGRADRRREARPRSSTAPPPSTGRCSRTRSPPRGVAKRHWQKEALVGAVRKEVAVARRPARPSRHAPHHAATQSRCIRAALVRDARHRRTSSTAGCRTRARRPPPRRRVRRPFCFRRRSHPPRPTCASPRPLASMLPPMGAGRHREPRRGGGGGGDGGGVGGGRCSRRRRRRWCASKRRLWRRWPRATPAARSA